MKSLLQASQYVHLLLKTQVKINALECIYDQNGIGSQASTKSGGVKSLFRMITIKAFALTYFYSYYTFANS